MKSATPKMPVVFLPHGGGPWPFVDVGMGSKEELAALANWIRGIQKLAPSRPKALLVVSAHWEEATVSIMTNPHPPMLYDYFGFPPESYQLTWPAASDAGLTQRMHALLNGAGISTKEDKVRGFDHGTFVPLKLAYPNAEIPTVQLSLKAGLDPAEHLAIGRALAPLREEGVFIIGSGMTYHNLREFFGPRAAPDSEQFDQWLRFVMTGSRAERDRALLNWKNAPLAKEAHPREEHLLPLMVIAGAAGEDLGVVAYNGTIVGIRLSAYTFGA